jgi:hypothetical protein
VIEKSQALLPDSVNIHPVLNEDFELLLPLLRGRVMRSHTLPKAVKLLLISCLLGFMILLPFSYAQGPMNIQELEHILGTKGNLQAGVWVASFPRSDLKVAIEGVPVPPAFGFGSWTAWKETGQGMMVMGDLVLLEKEITPVIPALADSGIQITAIHNHLIGEQPRVMYMHIHGSGPASRLAQGIRRALDQTATPPPLSSPGSPVPPAPALETKRLEEIIRHPGQSAGGVFKIIVGRPGVKAQGMELTASMGMNSWIGMIGTEEIAHAIGDIAMLGPEVNPVIQTLRRHGIKVVALHNHMLDEDPRIFFLHYWGTGRPQNLAQAFRDALDQLKAPFSR